MPNKEAKAGNSDGPGRSADVVVGGDLNARVLVKVDLPKVKPVRNFYMISPPIDCFYGRQKYMSKLSQALDSCKNRTNWTDSSVLIKGIGGIGKSDLVRMFVKKRKSVFKNVAWINSENEDAVIASFQELGTILKLCPPGGGSIDPKQLARSIYRHVAQHVESPLFIFDNAVVLRTGGEQFGILDWLSTIELDRYPQTIITSQSTEWETSNMKNILLEPLEIPETVAFYKNYFKLTGRASDEELQQQLEVLSALVQGLPLAMIMSASCMKFYPDRHSLDVLKHEVRMSIDLFEAPGDDPLVQKIGKFMPAEYAHTMATVWKRSLERIAQHEHGPVSFHLLYMLAYLPSTGAPEREVIKVDEIQAATEAQAGTVQKPEDKVFFGKLTLKKFCLVAIFEHTFFKESLRVHRLVQKMVRSDPQSLTVIPKILRHIECRELYYESNLRPIYEVALTNKLIHVDALPSYIMVTCDLLVNSNKFGTKFMACLKQWTPGRHERPSGKVVTPLESDLLLLVQWVNRIIEEDELLNVNETIREAVAIGKKWRPCVDSERRRVHHVVLDVLLVLSQKYCKQLKPLEMETVKSLNGWLEGFPNVDDEITSTDRRLLRMIRLVNVMENLRAASAGSEVQLVDHQKVLKLLDAGTLQKLQEMIPELHTYSQSGENMNLSFDAIAPEDHEALKVHAKEFRTKYFKPGVIPTGDRILDLIASIIRSGDPQKLKEFLKRLMSVGAHADPGAGPGLKKFSAMLNTLLEDDKGLDVVMEFVISESEKYTQLVEKLGAGCVDESGQFDESKLIQNMMTLMSSEEMKFKTPAEIAAAYLEDTRNKGGLFKQFDWCRQSFEQFQDPQPGRDDDKIDLLLSYPGFDDEGIMWKAVENELKSGSREPFHNYFAELKEIVAATNDQYLIALLERLRRSILAWANSGFSNDVDTALAQGFKDLNNELLSGDKDKIRSAISFVQNNSLFDKESSPGGPLDTLFHASAGNDVFTEQLVERIAATANPEGLREFGQQLSGGLTSFLADSTSDGDVDRMARFFQQVYGGDNQDKKEDD